MSDKLDLIFTSMQEVFGKRSSYSYYNAEYSRSLYTETVHYHKLMRYLDEDLFIILSLATVFIPGDFTFRIYAEERYCILSYCDADIDIDKI